MTNKILAFHKLTDMFNLGRSVFRKIDLNWATQVTWTAAQSFSKRILPKQQHDEKIYASVRCLSLMPNSSAGGASLRSHRVTSSHYKGNLGRRVYEHCPCNVHLRSFLHVLCTLSTQPMTALDPLQWPVRLAHPQVMRERKHQACPTLCLEPHVRPSSTPTHGVDVTCVQHQAGMVADED